MKITDIISALELDIRVDKSLDREIKGCYVSDMLSDVLANSHEGNLWITRQTHPNIVAVAAIKGLAGIVITGGKAIDPDTVQKAEAEDVPLMSTPLSSFEAAGIFYGLSHKEKG
jgi:predicted transcriptional regulator